MKGVLATKSIRRVLDAIVMLAISLTLSAFAINSLLAQNPAAEKESVSKSMSFDAVSIRPTDPNTAEIPMFGVEANTFFLKNMPLIAAIVTAFYGRGEVPSNFVDTLPKWVLEKISILQQKSPRRTTNP